MFRNSSVALAVTGIRLSCGPFTVVVNCLSVFAGTSFRNYEKLLNLMKCLIRLCAVFGGLYCLKRAAQQILFDDSHKVLGILSENQTLKAPVVFLENSLVPNAKVKGGISRAILITDR